MISNHPGPWQQYHFRSDNRGLSIMELKSKYLHEQYLFENELFNLQQQHQQNVFMNGGGGGPLSTQSAPTYSTALKLTFNDTLANMATNYGYNVTSATAWNNTGRFTFNGSNSNFGTVEVVDNFSIILKGNEEGLAVEVDTFSGDTYLTFIEDLNANCITEVKDGAFNAAVLERVTLGAMTTVGGAAFAGCGSLGLVRFTSLTTIPNAGDVSSGVFASCDLSGDNLGTMFPALVTIGDFAFYRTNIPTINSSTITTIGFRAFDSSTSLTSINLTNFVTFGNATGGRSFASCEGLINIALSKVCTFFNNNPDTFIGVANAGLAIVDNANINNPSILYIKNTLGWSVNP